MEHDELTDLRKVVASRDEAVERLSQENVRLRALLEEAADWLCPHGDAPPKYTQGLRAWCSDCHNYLRKPEDWTLLDRVRQVLGKIDS